MYCPECGKGTNVIYEIVATKTLTQRKPESTYTCDECFVNTLKGLISKGKTLKVRIVKQ